MPSKSGRHHNRNGLRQIKKGSLAGNTQRLAKRLGIPYRNPTQRAADGACTCDVLSVMGGVMLGYKKDCPVPSHAAHASH